MFPTTSSSPQLQAPWELPQKAHCHWLIFTPLSIKILPRSVRTHKKVCCDFNAKNWRVINHNFATFVKSSYLKYFSSTSLVSFKFFSEIVSLTTCPTSTDNFPSTLDENLLWTADEGEFYKSQFLLKINFPILSQNFLLFPWKTHKKIVYSNTDRNFSYCALFCGWLTLNFPHISPHLH